MRVEIHPGDAAIVASALRAVPGGYEGDRLAALFEPPEPVAAILLPRGAVLLGGVWTAEDDEGAPVYLHPDHGWLPRVDTGEPVGHVTVVPTCSRCGGQTFGYEEGTYQYWSPGDVVPDDQGGTVGLWSEGWDGVGDGDGQPGLMCDPYRGGCGAPIELPEGWEIAWD